MSAANGNFGIEYSLFKGSLARLFYVFRDQQERVGGSARAMSKKPKKNLLKAIFRFLDFYRRAPKPGPVGQMRAPALSGASHAQIAQPGGFGKMRSSFDFAPYRRSTVGFDRLFDLLETDLRGDGGEG